MRRKIIFSILTSALVAYAAVASPLAATKSPVTYDQKSNGSFTMQGTDVIPGAPIGVGGPYAGTTTGYTDDYEEACPYTGSTSADVVYDFSAPAYGNYSFDLLGSAYDTKLFIYDAALNLIACNDDFHPDYTSYLEVGLGTGVYHVIIDGYGGGDGDYTLFIAQTPELGTDIMPGTPVGVGQYAGNTCGFVNDYDEACPYTGGTAPDVVYEFTTTGGSFIFDLCGSDYDTKLYIYDGLGALYACNDDFCPGYMSWLELVGMPADTYQIIVDGYGTSCGDYLLVIAESEAEPCLPIDCADGATAEGEAVCFEGFVDDFNGGCNSVPDVWGTIAMGETVCGTSGTYLTDAGGNSRDTDWFLFDRPEDGYIEVSILTDFPAYVFVLGTSIDCVTADIISAPVPIEGCVPYFETLTFDDTYEQYALWVGPNVFDGVDCGATYNLTLGPVPALGGDTCGDALEIAVPGLEIGNTCGYTDTVGNPASDVWYHFNLAVDCDVVIDLCASTYDTYVRLFADDCITELFINDDACGLQSILDLPGLAAGDYYIAVEGYSSSCGDYVLEIFGDCDPTLVEPTEFALAQNYPNPFNPTTTIDFSLAEPGFTTLTVYSITGQSVATLVEGELAAGAQSVVFDASGLSSGVYFYSLNAGTLTDTKKMILVK
jgi:hypothetical protein